MRRLALGRGRYIFTFGQVGKEGFDLCGAYFCRMAFVMTALPSEHLKQPGIIAA